jgi:hypothetical protein
MEYFIQKYPYIYMIQWIIATLYASGMYGTLGEEIACKAISVFVFGYNRVCQCQPIESVDPC